MHLKADGAGAGERALGSILLVLAHDSHSVPTSFPEKPPSVSVVEFSAKAPRTPHPKFGLDVEVDDSHAPREFERLVTHSKDFQEDLGGHKLVQVG